MDDPACGVRLSGRNDSQGRNVLGVMTIPSAEAYPYGYLAVAAVTPNKQMRNFRQLWQFPLLAARYTVIESLNSNRSGLWRNIQVLG